jgi:hypothetical protein
MTWALVYGMFHGRIFWKALILGGCWWVLAFTSWYKFKNPATIELFRKW